MDSSKASHSGIDNSGNDNYAACYPAPGFDYSFDASIGYHARNVEVQHMEPFERLLSLHTSEQWMLDQISWQAAYPENSLTDQSSQSLYCNPADLLPRTSSAPPPASDTTPEPDGLGVHRTASTRIKTARRSNVTTGAPRIAPPERPVISLEGRTATTGRTARKHKLYLSSLDLDRPHVCRYCRARFDRPGDCERHVRAHEKDQEFWCHNPQCPASPEYRIFYRADARQRHWQRHVECWDWWYSTPEGRTYYELHKKKITHLPPSILAELAARGEAPPKPRVRRSASRSSSQASVGSFLRPHREDETDKKA